MGAHVDDVPADLRRSYVVIFLHRGETSELGRVGRVNKPLARKLKAVPTGAARRRAARHGAARHGAAVESAFSSAPRIRAFARRRIVDCADEFETASVI